MADKGHSGHQTEGLEGDADLGSERPVNDALQNHDHLLDDDGEEDDECGPVTEYDVVDDALDSVINLLVAEGYDEVDAEDAVFNALEQLHHQDQSSDTPDVDEPEVVKTAWIFNTIPRLKAKLREMGLEFDQDPPLTAKEV